MEGPHGRDWGSLIHALLEYAVSNLGCSRSDLDAVARCYLENGSAQALVELIPHAIDTVEAVRASELWTAVRHASRVLAEVPAGALRTEDGVVVERGIIDLAMELADGWHIVDYKTDSASVEQLKAIYGPQVRAYASLWERATRHKVAFAGIFSVREQRLSADVWVPALSA